MKSCNVVFYEAEDEKYIENVLEGLPHNYRAKLVAQLEVLEETGRLGKRTCSIALGNGIFEFRYKLNSNCTLAVYFFFYRKDIVLLNVKVKEMRLVTMDTLQLINKRYMKYLSGLGQGKSLERYKEEQMTNKSFAKAYNIATGTLNMVQQLIEARVRQNISQRDLAKKVGIDQAEISRLENSGRNISLSLLERIAEALNLKLKIQLVSKGHETKDQKSGEKSESGDSSNLVLAATPGEECATAGFLDIKN